MQSEILILRLLRQVRRDRRTPPGSAGVPPAPGRRPAMDDPPKAHRCVQAGKPAPAWGKRGMPALVWSAPPLQGRSCSGTQVRLHACIRPLRWEPRFPGPDGIRARLASTPRRPRTGPARAQARGMPVRPVLPSTSLLPRNHWRPHCRLESPRWGRIGAFGPPWNWGTERFARAVHGRGPLTGRSAGGQAVRIAVLAHEPFAVAAYAAAGAT